MAIATLTVDINAKLAGIQGDLGKVSRMAEQNAKRIEDAFSSAGLAIKGAFAGLSIGGFAALIKGVADAGDQLQKLSTKTGAAVEDLSKLNYAASLSDLSTEDLGAALVKLNRVMGDAAGGSKEAADALARFGVLPNSGKSVIEVFTQISERVKATGDETKIASALNDLFGKSFSGLIPLLKSGEDGIKSAGDELERLNGVMSGEMASASEAFNDNITRLNKKLDALKVENVGPLIKLFLELSNAMVDASGKSSDISASSKVIATVFETIAVLGANVVYVFKAVGAEIGGVAAQMAALGRLDFKAFSAIGDAMKEDAAKARKDIDALSDRLLNAGKPVKIEYSNEGRGREILPPKAEGITDTVNKIKTGGARSGSRAGKAIDDGARLVEQLRDQIRATQELTEVEKLELAIADGKYKTASAGNIALAMSYAETLDNIKATKKAVEEEAEAHKKRLDVFAEGARVTKSVRTPVEALNAEIEHLLELLDAKAISMETFGRAASKAGDDMQRLESKTEETADTLTEFARSAAQNMQTAFADFLFDPFSDGTDSMLKKFGETIKRMIAEAASAEIMKRLFGDFGSKGGGGGQIGGWVGSILSSLPSFDVGTPYVPRDMVAKVHQGERIVPAAQNRAGGGGQSISVVINMAGGSSGSDLRQSAGDIARRIGQTVSGAARYA